MDVILGGMVAVGSLQVGLGLFAASRSANRPERTGWAAICFAGAITFTVGLMSFSEELDPALVTNLAWYSAVLFTSGLALVVVGLRKRFPTNS